MDRLLAQEELTLKPLKGRFDVGRESEAILAIPHAWRDEFVPGLFLIFLDDERRAECAEQRRNAPEAPLPYVLLIRVQPDAVLVNQFAGPEYADASRAYLEGLAARHRCTVRNEAGLDLTEHWPAPR